jgi:hypothetical protein
VPFEIIEMLDPIIEDMVISARLRERDANDSGIRYTLDEIAKKYGLEEIQ